MTQPSPAGFERAPLPDDFIALRYADASRVELRQARREIKQLYERELAATLRALEAGGRFEFGHRSRLFQAPPLRDVSGEGPIRTASVDAADPELVSWTQVPPGEYPGVYELRDEFRWLVRRTWPLAVPIVADTREIGRP